jgi:phospholipid-transporting ATPase
MKDNNHENNDRIHRFLTHLALCHTVIIDEKEEDERNKISYNASSPDELALVNAARYFGYFFKKRDNDDNMVVVHPDGSEEKYTLLNVIEFDSDRKRMSVIVKFPDDKIKILCKGADSVIFARLKNKDNVDGTNKYLSDYAKEGLRTLLLAEKEISEQDYEAWSEKYNEAALSLQNREEAINQVAEQIEKEFELIGATAIEDKLQDDVANTISILKKAGIKIWVLTGDKIETAINIGYSCHVLSDDMYQHLIDGESSAKIMKQLVKALKKYSQQQTYSHALIIGGDSLMRVSLKEDLLEKFMNLAENMKVVLACRVSPKQKAEVVKFVKNRYPQATTLAIGDGANDVNMITSADVGVGISGLEGQQASRASDFAIGQFKFLRTLLLFHGRESYRRIAYTVGYMFYKNVIVIMTAFWFGLVSNYSGQPIFDQWLYQFYGIAFTAFAIMWFAVFDYEYPKDVLLNDPKYYVVGLENLLFTNYRF